MTNAELAKTFTELGELLEYQGENPFRVRAYYQVARTIEFHPEPLSRVYERDGREGLLSIPGIGEAIADKVIELLETNRLYFYEQVKKKVAPIILELADIPGVGPKTAKKIYEAWKPKSIAGLKKDLEKALKKTTSTKAVRGFHQKTLKNLLRGIEAVGNLGQRLTLTEALPTVELFVKRLTKLPALKQIDPVGSLRRMKETVGDIDLIAASNDPKTVIETFVTSPNVSQILAQGPTKAMVMTNQRTHVDLEILPAQEYGSLLQHFTGSKEHNIAFRSLVDNLGLSFSEHGFKVLQPNHPWAKQEVRKAKRDKRWDERRQLILCSKEEQVYATIGLPWIPAELRENSGELEAAKAGTLPKLVELNDLKGDIHVHSNRSGDGREEPAVLIERAIALKYQYLGITDHTQGLGVAGKLSNKELINHAQALRKLNQRYPEIRVLAGCELNILADGSLDVPDAILQELDVVVASVHSAFAQSREVMTNRILRAIENPHVDILAHPTTRILNYRGEIQADWDRIFARAAQTQTALEINAYPERLDLESVRIRSAKAVGCRFVISTDSHQVGHFENMRFGVSCARRGWCEPKDILNTYSLNEFRGWLARSI